jgi:hypothetical protein
MVVIWQQLRGDELALLQRLSVGAKPDGSAAFDRLFSEDLVTRDGLLKPYGYSLLNTMNE